MYKQYSEEKNFYSSLSRKLTMARNVEQYINLIEHYTFNGDNT